MWRQVPSTYLGICSLVRRQGTRPHLKQSPLQYINATQFHTKLICSVVDPKQKVRIRFRIRILPAVSFESGFESESESSDSDPDQNLENFFFCTKFFNAASSSNLKRLSSLSSVTFMSVTDRIWIRLEVSDPVPDPDPQHC
jgi:hypothetical protein